MTPAEEMHILKTALDRSVTGPVVLPRWNVRIHTHSMESRHAELLPGGNGGCPVHGLEFPRESLLRENGGVHARDAAIRENRRFHYHTFETDRSRPARGAIVLIHGLNEKSWDKYLPWALRLNRGTGKTVILFPMAFHMDRAPRAWSAPRNMQRLCRDRARRHPRIRGQSLANAAISERLESHPKRFVWSGLQSLQDLLYLCRSIRAGLHPRIVPDPGLDLFAYSIGAFLGLIAIMADPGNLFSRSRLFCFCGGCVLNRAFPTSRYIMDSEANIALYALYVEHLDNETAGDPRLAHYLSPLHPEGMYFHALLDLHRQVDRRDRRLRELHRRIQALVLERDRVMPPLEVSHTLQGRDRTIPIRVWRQDFPFQYSHENPFPRGAEPAAVQRSMKKVFSRACAFLSR